MPLSKTVKTLKLDGMTCVSCENRIERKLNSIRGIISAQVSYSEGTATIIYNESEISPKEIIFAIEQLNYKVIESVQKVGRKPEVSKILGIGIIIFALYILISRFNGLNIFNAFPLAEAGMGYGMLFVIGLLTSMHCVAMCGGINLSQCVPSPSANTTSGKLASLMPGILYNLGRIISYTVVGGVVGAAGSLISFSGTAKGVVQIAAGVFMVVIGLNMLNIFPWLRMLNPRIPKIFALKINKQKSRKSPLYVGLINGLIPCGPLQAMQLYALSTGDPVKGAVSMLLFSLGTVPLMFGFGALSSVLSKKFTGKMMRTSAVLVVVLGMFMFSSGMSLSGFVLPSIGGYTSVTANRNAQNTTIAKIADGVQTVTYKLSPGRYEPITVQKGIPVKWTIQAQADDINGCNNKIVIPKFNYEIKLKAGDNMILFTPNESGIITYSCWMGMIRSKITVVDNLNDNNYDAAAVSSDSS